MQNKKSLAVTLLMTAMLVSCGGNSSAPTSSDGASSTPASAGASDSSVVPSSSESKPVSNVFNGYALANRVATVLNKYRSTVTFQTIADAVNALKEPVDLDPSSETKASEVAAVLILAEGFKQALPDRIGARSFQGYYFDPASIELRKVEDDSDTGDVRKALKYLSETGIFNVPASTSLSGGKAYAERNLNKIFDRIHAYFGESYVDDFFSTVNHDYLYDENPNVNVPADGRKSWDEVYDSENLTSIYDSRLIPEEDIVDWALDLAPDVSVAGNFIETYTDWDARATGKAAGMVAGIQKYLDAKTAEEFIEVCREMAKEQGFCILWSEYSANNLSYMGTPLLHITSYNYADSSSTAAGNKATSTARFKPIFQEVLGCEDAEAQKLAEDYSQFKVDMARAKERDDLKDGIMITTSDDELVEKTPTLYFKSSFSTGETLDQFFQSLGFEPNSVAVNSCLDTRAIVSLITDETLDLVKGLAVWQMLQHYTICLPDTEAVNAWAWKPGYGTNAKTLWDEKSAFYAYGMKYLSGAFANAWMETPTFEADANAVIDVTLSLKEALLQRIEAADWLSQDAKDKATLKCNNMAYSIGGKNSDGSYLSYPETPYKGKADGSLYGNIGIYESIGLVDAAKLVGHKDGGRSFTAYVAALDPLTANAFYMPSYNGINITLGYMACYAGAGQATKQKLLEDYGWVVGHEISHGFDSNGIEFDESGNKPEGGWFQKEDFDAYLFRCKDVSDYYKGYEVMPERATEGSTVVTEAIADINGLHIALEVAKNLSDFDYRSFFIAQAKHFASYSSQYVYAGNLASDEHPFGRARVNLAVQTVDEWHEAFETKEGDNMYVTPADRIRIW